MNPSFALPFRWLAKSVAWLAAWLAPLAVSALPAVQSLSVDPSPLQTGQNFAISATGTDIAQATATVDFRPWSATVLRVTLRLQNGAWKGSGAVPASLNPPPGAKALVKVLALDAARARAEKSISVGVVRPPAPAITAVFDPALGLLTVTGDVSDNNLVVGRDTAGLLRVNNGSIPITGGIATTANTTRIRMLGLGGNDLLSLDESNGALPSATLEGGEGADTLTGGSAADSLFGGPGPDSLRGLRGNDLHFGGAGNDVFVWDPGDGSDLIEGDADEDTLVFNGSNASEIFNLVANGSRLVFTRDVGNITMDLANVEIVKCNAIGGTDQVIVGDLTGTAANSVSLDFSNPPGSGTGDAAVDSVTVNGTANPDVITIGNLAADVTVNGLSAAVRIAGTEGATDRLVVNALAGNDTVDASGLSAGKLLLTMNGGLGEDVLLGSAGDDIQNGGDGDDVVFGSAGDDTMVWNPGDDNDTLEGQAGTDRMLFNGANVAEVIDLAANGGRFRFFRNIANVVMDGNDVEIVEFNAIGGADSIVVNDLSGTDVTQVRVDLSISGNPGAGDGQPDSVGVNGSNAAEAILVSQSGSSLIVSGTPATVTILGVEGSTDSLFVDGRGGNDTISASGLPSGLVNLVLGGGNGNDTLTGSRGGDTLFGGADDDTFIWNPGDGSDVLEGQGGTDTLLFRGSNANESVSLAANGPRLVFFRDPANITMDCADLENVTFNALGGSDTIVVSDLSGTAVSRVDLDLASSQGGPLADGQPDQITVAGTQAADVISIAGDAAGVQISGLATTVSLTRIDPGLDTLTLNALGGNDVVDASSLAANAAKLTLQGGLGLDVLLGGDGDDTLAGGDGDDAMFGGAGDDTLVWNPGDDNDVLEGQAGFDRMLFNGANVAETIEILANGGRVIFFRNVANVTMDLNDVEEIEFNALGGADTTVVHDLAGTDVTQVSLNLAASGGLGDGAADSIIINATSDDDEALVVGSAGDASVFGLSAQIDITGAETANDRLTVNLLAGDDVLEASGLAANSIQLTGNGGDDDDVLVGGSGNDTLLGGLGDDVLVGGPGLDVLDGGPGSNVVIQD